MAVTAFLRPYPSGISTANYCQIWMLIFNFWKRKTFSNSVFQVHKQAVRRAISEVVWWKSCLSSAVCVCEPLEVAAAAITIIDTHTLVGRSQNYREKISWQKVNNHGVLLLFTPKTPYWFEGSQYIDFTMYWITTAGFWGTFVLAFEKYDDKNIIFGCHKEQMRFWEKKNSRPWQDSNLQSPDPKSGALSIRPHGRLY